MSDLYPRELAERLGSFEPATTVEPGVWTGFMRGTPQLARRAIMRGLQGIDMAGAVGPIVQDTFTGGTEAQDRYFKENDELYGRAIEHLTPKAGEVGIAGNNRRRTARNPPVRLRVAGSRRFQRSTSARPPSSCVAAYR